MNHISIIPIKTLNLKTKNGTLSNYAQRFIKPQIKCISIALEKLLLELDPDLLSGNKQKLEELGIKQIGRNLGEGIFISDNKYDYHVYSLNEEYLLFDIFKTNNDEIYRHFRLSDNSNEYFHGGKYAGFNIEDEISKVLDFIDNKLFKAKSLLTNTKNLQFYYPTAVNVSKPDIITSHKLKNSNINNTGYIGSKEAELIQSINDKFLFIQDLYKQISDGKTRYKVRSAYKNYIPQPVANKIGFKNIGPNGESVSLFKTSYKNNTYTSIIHTDTDGKESKFVISKNNNSVQKNFPSKFVKSENSEYRICLTPDYYTQEEVDKSNLCTYLDCLNKEMDLFIDYTQNWFKEKEEKKLIKSDFDNANLNQYKDLLDDIHANFENYRTKMRKYLRKPLKSKKFKTENNISTKLTSTAVKFDNITPEGNDLRLSFPKVRDKIAMQLLVMNDNKIENSFYILNNKLLRFKVKDLNDKLSRHNGNLHYYDNTYLQNSNLHSYLLLIKDKLHELNKKLDIIRSKQIENRTKYHNEKKK